MRLFLKKLGIFPYLMVGIFLVLLGVYSLNHLVNNYWFFDPNEHEAVRRAVALGQANPQMLLEVALMEIIIAFLSAAMSMVVGLSLPIVYFLNYRFIPQHTNFFVIFRQSMWIGFWVAFCIWLQMNRTMGIAIALLVATVFILFEILLHVRHRSATLVTTPPSLNSNNSPPAPPQS